jgi:C4-dicarboxylate-binding protein DctP
MPADLKGKKMRIQSSKVLEEEIRALSALPQVMAFSEVYQALQTGVVDGTENPISNLYTQKMFEVQKHLALTEHGYLGYAVIVNKKFWEGLPADVRSQLEAAMKESTAYANKIAKEQNDKDLEAVKKTGKTQVYVLTSRRADGLQEGAGAGACEDGIAHRQGSPAVGVQGNRFRSDQALSIRLRKSPLGRLAQRAFFQADRGSFDR